MSVQKIDLFFYAWIIVFSMAFITKIVQPTFTQIVVLLTGLSVVYYIYSNKQTNIDFALSDLENKLNSLRPVPKFFHLDSDFIKVFYNIKEFRKYNKPAYDNALIAVDNVLQIQNDIEKTNNFSFCEHNLDIANDFMIKSLNYLHSIIHKLPDNIIVRNKFQESIKTIQLLLIRHLDTIFKLCQKNKKTNIYSTPRYNRGPSHNDIYNQDYNPSFNYF